MQNQRTYSLPKNETYFDPIVTKVLLCCYKNRSMKKIDQWKRIDILEVGTIIHDNLE